MLFVVCCWLLVVICLLLFVGSLFVVGCWLVVGGCCLFVVCRSLFGSVVGCVLLVFSSFVYLFLLVC